MPSLKEKYSCKKSLKFGVIFLVTLVVVLSDFAPTVLEKFGATKLADSLKVNKAYALVPTFQAIGTFTSGTGALSVPVPVGYQNNDVFVLFVESANEAIATPAGWTQAANSPQFTGTAGATGGVRLGIFYKVVSGVQAAVPVVDTGDHTTAIIANFRGVDTVSPINITSGSVDAAAVSAINTPGLTTTIPGALVINAIGLDKDFNSSNTIITAPVNASLTNIVKQFDQTANSGRGGGIAFFTGSKVVAGVVGNTTATADTSTTHAYITVALNPAPVLVTGYTNSTEAGLNYSAACTGCGARIGGGAGFRQSVTITGTWFGADPGVGFRSSATNNIKIGTHQIVDANIVAWSTNSITFLTDSSVAGDTDSDWGIDFGGASSMTVTASGLTSAGINFYVFPQVTSVTQPSGLPMDAAREYSAADTDGIVTLNGTRFGGSQGSGSATIVGQTATIGSWTNTAIQAQVPVTIADTTNTGSIVMTQGTGTQGKTDTYANTIRILPRITGFVPSSASEGTAVTVSGNHFCQGVSCPIAFSASDKVTFATALDATTFTSWSATAIVTVLPVGVVTGGVLVTSNSYTSDISSLTVIPNTPLASTNLNQWKNVGLTQPIAVGGAASSTPIYLTMTMEVAGVSGGVMYPQIEYKPIGTPFVCGAGACASAVEGAGIAGPGPVDCVISNCNIAVSPTDDIYHWQARTKHTRNGVDYYSAWVSFNNVNPETSTDFQIDTTGPAITNVSSGTPGTNSATITWSTLGELSTSQIQYNTTGIFVTNCATNSDCTTLDPTMVNSHNPPSLANLNSGTTYYYRVRSKDIVGNEIISLNYTFLTQSVTAPAKTTKTYIDGAIGQVTSATTYHFSMNAPETAPSVLSAYVEVFGIMSGGVGAVSVQANGAASRSYDVSATNPTFYRFLYPISSPNTETNLNLNDVAPCSNGSPFGTPPCNIVTLTPSAVNMYVLSAKIITTYSYTP